MLLPRIPTQRTPETSLSDLMSDLAVSTGRIPAQPHPTLHKVVFPLGDHRWGWQLQDGTVPKVLHRGRTWSQYRAWTRAHRAYEKELSKREKLSQRAERQADA